MKIESKSGWIFSAWLDPIVFVGLALIVLGLASFSHFLDWHVEDLFLWFLISDYLVSSGHVFGTIPPVFIALERKRFSRFAVVFGFLSLVAFTFILFHWSKTGFGLFVASFLMFHYIRQNVGWVHISERKSGQPLRWIDDLAMYNFTLLPFAWHLADPSFKNKTLYYEGDLNPIRLSPSLSDPIHGLILGIAVLYFVDQLFQIRKNKKVNWAKYNIMLSGICCFYLPYIIFPYQSLFWAPNLIVHGVTYTIFTYQYSKEPMAPIVKNLRLGQLSWLFKSFFAYLLIIFILGVLWSESFRWFDKGEESLLTSILLPLVWSVSIIHFFTDGIIWKRRFLQPVTIINGIEGPKV